MDHTIYQSRRKKGKEINPGIGIIFGFVEAAEYLSKCLKFGKIDEHGGIKIKRRIGCYLVSGGNEEADCDIGTPTGYTSIDR